MAAPEQVKQYQRRTQSGTVVTVHAHQRTGADVNTAAKAMPGRPPLAAKSGTFPGGRSVPNVFVMQPSTPPVPEPPKPGEPNGPITIRKSPNSPTVDRVVQAVAAAIHPGS